MSSLREVFRNDKSSIFRVSQKERNRKNFVLEFIAKNLNSVDNQKRIERFIERVDQGYFRISESYCEKLYTEFIEIIEEILGKIIIIIEIKQKELYDTLAYGYKEKQTWVRLNTIFSLENIKSFRKYIEIRFDDITEVSVKNKLKTPKTDKNKIKKELEHSDKQLQTELSEFTKGVESMYAKKINQKAIDRRNKQKELQAKLKQEYKALKENTDQLDKLNKMDEDKELAYLVYNKYKKQID